jgi:hypothetical protein
VNKALFPLQAADKKEEDEDFIAAAAVSVVPRPLRIENSFSSSFQRRRRRRVVVVEGIALPAAAFNVLNEVIFFSFPNTKLSIYPLRRVRTRNEKMYVNLKSFALRELLVARVQ